MEIAAICAIAIVGAVLSLTLKKSNPEGALLTTLATGIIVVSFFIAKVPEVLKTLDNMFGATGLATDYGEILVKAVGICLICQFASDTCRDSGQNGLAVKVETTGRLMIVLLALPLINAVVEVTTKLL